MTTRMVTRSDCAFAYEITVHDEHPQVIPMRTQRPPAHFHPYQCEFLEVLEGQMGLEIGGCDRVLRPEDGQVRVEPWTIHRLFAPPLQTRETRQPDKEAAGRITRFLLSGEDTTELFKLDTIFFQNWYKYQEEVEKGRTRMNLIQVMCVSPRRCSSGRLCFIALAHHLTCSDLLCRCLTPVDRISPPQVGYPVADLFRRP